MWDSDFWERTKAYCKWAINSACACASQIIELTGEKSSSGERFQFKRSLKYLRLTTCRVNIWISRWIKMVQERKWRTRFHLEHLMVQRVGILKEKCYQHNKGVLKNFDNENFWRVFPARTQISIDRRFTGEIMGNA